MNIQISTNETNIRLDKFLAEKMPQHSRSFLTKLIKDGSVLVNGKSAKASYKLQIDDDLQIDVPEEIKDVIRPENIDLDIIHEDENLLIVNKPAGMVIHPDMTHKSGTLVNAILGLHQETKDAGETERPGIVHRLDKDTSGLVVTVKTSKAYDFMFDLFKNKKITKKYYALVYGEPKDAEGVITYSLKKSSADKKIKLGPGKEALTRYKTVEVIEYENKKYSLLEVSPETGRTHQIRVHLKAIGHPIIGDQLYKMKNNTPPFPLERQFLHAFSLSFTNIDGKPMNIKIPLSSDLEEYKMSITN